MNALQPCTLEDIRVWDQLLPGDVKQSAQGIDMESVWLPCVPIVDCPCFTGIDESGHDYSFVDFQLCLEIESLSFPHILTKPSESCACFGNSCITLVVDKHISGHGTAEISEFVDSLQLPALDCDGWISVACVGCWLKHDLSFLCESKNIAGRRKYVHVPLHLIF